MQRCCKESYKLTYICNKVSKMRYTYLFFVLLLISSFTKGQQNNFFVFSGKILDKNQNPLDGASVYLHDVKQGKISLADGKFEFLSIKSGRYLVEVSYQGYSAHSEIILINKDVEKNFYLSETIVEQEAVIVTGVSTATRIKNSPQPISQLKSSDLHQLASTNIIESLNRVNGVFTVTTGPAISKPIIRGLGYNRIITINDGVKQEGQQWGDEHGIEVDEMSVQKIEILKGPASLMYGSDAMAGVINIISNTAVNQGTFSGSIISNYQTNNKLWAQHFQLGAYHKNGLNWNAYGTFKSAADYNNKYDGIVLNSRFKELNFGGYVGINKSWGYSHLLISKFNQKTGLVEGERDATTGEFLLFSGNPLERIATRSDLESRDLFIPYQKIQHLKISTDNNILFKKGRLTFNAGYQENRRSEFGDVLNNSIPSIYFDLKTLNYNVQYHFEENNGWRTSVGLNGMSQSNKNLAEETLIPEYNLLDAGLFFFSKKSFENLNVSGGLRYDVRIINGKELIEGGNKKFENFTKNINNITGSIGLSYEANKNVILKLNVARGFRAPNLAELASNGAHEGTNRYEYGMKNLQSEISLQVDAGIDINTEHISFGADVFYNSINHFIFYNRLQSKLGTDSLVLVNGDLLQAFQFNQQDATLIGAEVKIDIHPHPLDWLHFENNFSYVRGTFKQKVGQSLNIPFIPPTRYRGELRADFKKLNNSIQKFFLKTEWEYMFAQKNIFSSFNTETITPSYGLLNVGLGFDVMNQQSKKLFSVFLAANNITNVSYQNHLSRLKYTSTNNATGRDGVFNMGTNFSIKIVKVFSHYL